ncbi:MAG: phytanoyl-CoA hydroxylase [Acidimicrobiales bacterium]|jgi:phytanoyl-CoA hydroxylase
MLTSAQVAEWERDGFLVLPDLISPERCDELMARGAELVADYDDSGIRSVFTTDDQVRKSDEKFLSSGGTIDFFWETEALDTDGNPAVGKSTGFNKMGHAQHDLDPVFDAFSRQDPLPELVADLGMADPLLLQSMLIFKHAGIGGEVTSHQDATFLYTDPITVIGLWFALEDATLENGCLFAQPGGHKGPLRQLFRRADAIQPDANQAHAPQTVFDQLDTTPLPELGDPELVPLEVEKGTCVVLHGLLPHGSHPNRSDASRQAYSLHVIDRGASYPDSNWLQRPGMPLRGF